MLDYDAVAMQNQIGDYHTGAEAFAQARFWLVWIHISGAGGGYRAMVRDIADRIQFNGGKNMEFITSAIASAVGSLGLEGVKHGYTKLKELLQGKFGEKSALAEAVEQLEKNPASAARKAVVAEELSKVGADKDEEVLAAAQQLQKVLKGVKPQTNVTQHITGNGNIVSGTGDMKVIHGDNFESGGGAQYIAKDQGIIQTRLPEDEPGKVK